MNAELLTANNHNHISYKGYNSKKCPAFRQDTKGYRFY